MVRSGWFEVWLECSGALLSFFRVLILAEKQIESACLKEKLIFLITISLAHLAFYDFIYYIKEYTTYGLQH